jgi:1-aminocyclopropane-1-carboxylate deaminase/D-cysteine desulfhydrase-like pyridoxal-dependent ACC family enzyme
LRTLGWDLELTPEDVESYDEYVGEAYGAPTEAGLAAMRLAARTESIGSTGRARPAFPSTLDAAQAAA